MPERARAPRRRKPAAQPIVSTANVQFDESKERYSAVATELGDFAAKLVVGQLCEAGCGTAARWAAIATDNVRWGCDEHLLKLLDRQLIWYLHAAG